MGIRAPLASESPAGGTVLPDVRRSWLLELFSIDLRSLAAVRIGLGGLLLADLCGRARFIEAHYTDQGVLPRVACLQLGFDGGLFPWMSPHMLGGSFWFQATLFAVAALFACCLLVGYRTRLAATATWFLLIGLQARNPLVIQGGDVLLRCLLFWCLFLPLGAVWSIDRRRRPGSPQTQRIVSGGTAALLLQLCAMYLFAAALKRDPAWRSEFSAIYYAICTDHFTSPLGYRLLAWPALLKFLTAATWLLEWCAPLLAFCPVQNGKLRMAIIATFAAFHIGLGLTMELGVFPAICIVYWLAFLPSGFWDWLARRRALARFAAWLNGVLNGIAGNWLNVRTVGNALRGVPRTTARAERHGGHSLQNRRARLSIWGGPLPNALALFLMFYVLMLNVRRLDGDLFAPLGPPPLRWVAKATSLDQCWLMFSPSPHLFGGWLVFRGTLSDGRPVDLWNDSDLWNASNLCNVGQGVPTEKPALVSRMYPSQQWRKCLTFLFELDEPLHRRGLADYLRRRWDQTHGPNERVAAVEIVNMMAPTSPPESQDTPPRIEPVVLLHAEYPARWGLRNH